MIFQKRPFKKLCYKPNKLFIFALPKQTLNKPLPPMPVHKTFTSLHIVHCSLSIVHSPAARHYHSDLSIWLSVDPLADKYPGLSPYTYCADNPVKLMDSDGDSLINFYKQIVINAQEIYNRAVSQNQPDLSHETKVLEEAKISCYYVDQFINGLSDDQYKALNNIKDNGKPLHKYNGHGKGDKSAEHAGIWETGIINLIND